MFVTFTLNPAIDRTLRLEEPLRTGGIHHLRAESRTPGGKGVNVAKLLAVRGCPVRATGLLGTDADDFYRSVLEPSGIEMRFAVVPFATRENLMLTGADGSEIKVNYPGFADLAPDRDRCLQLCDETCAPGDVAILSGSLPPGFPSDVYGRLILRLQTIGCLTVLDTSGEALVCGAAACPAVIKPNRRELECLCGAPAPTDDALADAAAGLAGRHEAVIVSDGARGACFASGVEVWQVAAPPVDARDSTGAGDAMLGQFCADYFTRRPRRLSDALMRRAVAAGSAAVEVDGTPVLDPARIDELAGHPQVRIRRVR